jgi:hypothetical protein
MQGEPIKVLKHGAQLIGEKYFEGEERPFERFYTYLYRTNYDTPEFEVSTKTSYKQRIDKIRAEGGTYPEVYLCVFYKIELLLARHPNINEITVIFFTDGHAEKYKNVEDGYDRANKRLKAHPGLKSRFLTVGFSRNHDAVFMRRIASFGTEQGNYIFIDTYEQNWQEELNKSLLDSMDMAVESRSNFKFKLHNAAAGDFKQENKCEIRCIQRQAQ